MKQLLSLLRFIPKRAAFVSALALGVMVPAATFAWGPSRPTYTLEHAADHPVFNSITDNPVQGDERNFVQIREADQSNDKYVDTISLKPDTEYVVYVYYHNNANSALNASGKAIAHGVYAKVQLPNIVKNGQSKVNAEGYIGAKDADPKVVFDEIYFNNTSGSDLSLNYEPGSATIHNQGKTDGDTLSDKIVSTGAPLGYDKLDGVIKGCRQYSGYVTLKFKTGEKQTTSYTVQKDVRLKGSSTWSNSVAATPGDTVQYEITYRNTGTAQQNNVVIKDSLPTGVTYVEGSSKLKNSNYPDGKSVSDNVVSTSGINVGDYSNGGTAYLLFDAKVADASTFSCGTKTLVNTASVGNKSDTADVTVKKTCTTPTPTPTPTPPTTTPTPPSTTTTTATTTTPPATTTPPMTNTSSVTPVAESTTLTPTGPTEVVSSVLGTGSLGLGVHHYLASRRALRKARL